MWGHGAAILVENEQAIVAQEAMVREGMGWRAIGDEGVTRIAREERVTLPHGRSAAWLGRKERCRSIGPTRHV